MQSGSSEEPKAQAVAADEPNDKNSPAKTEPPKPAEKLSEQVVNESGQPVPGVEVSLDAYAVEPEKTMTDAERRFELSAGAKLGNVVGFKAQAEEG